MRAVNLIPPDLQRGSSGIGRSGGAAQILLGALTGLLVLGTLYAVAHYQAADRRAQLTKATRDSSAALARAAQLAPYTQLAGLRSQREHDIAAVAAARFDWPAAMRNVASALPIDVHLSAFDSNAAGSGASGGPAPAAPSAAAAGASGAGAAPSIHLTGCAGSHTQVGDVINRLRGVPAVATVTFTSSMKAQGSATPTASSSCGSNPAQFDLLVAFGAPAAPARSGRPAGPAVPPGAAPSAGTPTPVSQSASPQSASPQGGVSR